jgi:hypothetical protein
VASASGQAAEGFQNLDAQSTWWRQYFGGSARSRQRQYFAG